MADLAPGSRSFVKTLLRGRYLAPTIVMLFAVPPMACKSTEEEPKPEVRIFWMSKGHCNTFFDISRYGAHLAAVELQDAGEAEVTVDLFEPDDCSDDPNLTAAGEVPEECAAAAPQMAKLTEAIEAKPQAIAISVANPTCITPLIDKAVEAGIEIVTFDSDAPDSKRHTYYGMDNKAAATLATKALAKLMKEQGEVAIQTSMIEDKDGNLQPSTSTSYVDRMAGTTEELDRHPELSLVATVPCTGNEITDTSCSIELEKLITEHPKLGGLVLVRGKVLRELELASTAPTLVKRIESGDLHVVAFDAPDDALDNILAGYADLVIAQKQFGWGYDVTKLAYEMVLDGLEPPKFSDSGWHVVCSNNVEQYASMWEEKDFREELEACDALEE